MRLEAPSPILGVMSMQWANKLNVFQSKTKQKMHSVIKSQRKCSCFHNDSIICIFVCMYEHVFFCILKQSWEYRNYIYIYISSVHAGWKVGTNLKDNNMPMEIQLSAAPESVQDLAWLGFHSLKDESNLDDKTASKFKAAFLSQNFP